MLPEANYEESEAGNLPLPSPLDGEDGGRIGTATRWNRRRAAICAEFARIMYGELPPRPEAVRFELRRECDDAIDGIAIRREIRIHLEQGRKHHCIDVLWYLPKSVKEPVPAIVGMNFRGNHACSPEPDVFPPEFFPLDEPVERGSQTGRWCFRQLVESGFSVATAFRGDLFPDRADGRADSVFRLYREADGLTPEHRELTAISAWAFGYVQMLELLETNPRIDRRRIWAHGHSRLGKTALWAAANEPRFAGVVSNDSGCCGAALSRRNFGETVGRITQMFPWWFQKELDRYAGCEAELPFDQHFLLALAAPRPVLVASATEDLWADPRGEFLSARAAGEVYRLFGCEGIGDAEFPAPEQPVFGDAVGYYLRTGIHDVTPVDWKFVTDFIRRNS